MDLENYIIEQFGVTEEDQQGVKNHIAKWRQDSSNQLIHKNPTYHMLSYMKQIEKDTNRYRNLGNVSR